MLEVRNDFVKVIGTGAYDAKTTTITLQGNTDYAQPKSGGIVVLEVIPKSIPKKVTAKTGRVQCLN